MKLITDRGWAWTPAQWELMLVLGPGWGAFDESGLVGTAMTTPYPEMQAISGVLVASRAGRRGIGTRLMSHVSGAGPSTLYATDMGEPLYARLGFHPVGATTDYHGVFRGNASGVSREATPADAEALAALDHEVSGFTRPELWRWLLDPATPHTVRMTDSGVVATRPNPEGITIGPLIAPSSAEACRLVSDVATGRVRVDTGDADVGAYLLEQGFEKRTGGCTLMVRGADDVPGDRSRYFAPASLALG
ncbi:Acetyltransferase (GNAT) domain-containing protein [Lentzea fradiae]|uniref:Acetyltransferase (GNAT) domain-containing protein n=1 Tax=Lentzea fradiae TaxID=200378 RepID=A0A1G8BY59_9PSEU|nr:GNAT family N-acetyltransferase [Lentzea fradiae]SDH38019.1 Acetyltransferase (GNAT) domain-containing protein [Lentzea fradiae]